MHYMLWSTFDSLIFHVNVSKCYATHFRHQRWYWLMKWHASVILFIGIRKHLSSSKLTSYPKWHIHFLKIYKCPPLPLVLYFINFFCYCGVICQVAIKMYSVCCILCFSLLFMLFSRWHFVGINCGVWSRSSSCYYGTFSFVQDGEWGNTHWGLNLRFCLFACGSLC